jgi:GDP-L-fucose synthase
MPTNLYGPNDNFDLNSSHVMPALIRKFHQAKTNQSPKVEIWGTGTPKREFLHVDDMAEASVFCLENVDSVNIYESGISHLNVGSGEDVTIAELVEIIKQTVGYEGKLSYDVTKPDGTPRKLMDVTRLAELGWKYKIKLVDGIKDTYKWYLEDQVT